MSSSLTLEYATLLREPHGYPRLSLYMPTHRKHPDRLQDPIRFRNLVRELETTLQQGHPEHLVRDIMQPLVSLAEDHDFWSNTLDGLAVLRSNDEFRVYRLQRPVPERAMVSEHFHVKPLIRIMQSVDRYQVLCLNRKNIRLLEGTRDALDEIPLASGVPATIEDALGKEATEPQTSMASNSGGGNRHHSYSSTSDENALDTERFFRAVDQAVHELHSRPTGLPLLIAALPEHVAVFRKVSHNSLVMASAIEGNPDVMDAEMLRSQAWSLIEPQYLSRLQGLVDSFQSALAKGHGSSDVAQAAVAACTGRVASLLVDADQRIAGRIANKEGNVEYDNVPTPTSGDVLDDLCESVLHHGGEVIVVPSHRMPTSTGLAATYRF